MTNLTLTETKVLLYIKEYFKKKYIAPTLEKIGQRFKFTKQRASQIVDALMRKGRVRKGKGYRKIKLI